MPARRARSALRRVPFLALLAWPGIARAESFLNPAGPVAALQYQHLLVVTAITLVVVIPVFVLTPWLVHRYRYGRRMPSYRPGWDMSKLFEWLSWSVPVVVVVVLGVLLWIRTHQLDPYAPVHGASGTPYEVEVIGYDWKWLFIYPEEGVASVGELAFPADRPLKLSLTSQTVMQSFFIPRLGGQIYAMNRMRTELNLAADKPGAFGGRNTQYNGRGFAMQSFTARAMSDTDFAAWVEAARSEGVPFDDAAREALESEGTKLDLRHALGMEDGTVVHFASAPETLFRETAGLEEHHQ